MPNNALTKIQRHQQSGAWHRLEKLANGGPQVHAQAEAVIAEAERLTAAAKALLHPGAVSPAKARMMRYPAKRT